MSTVQTTYITIGCDGPGCEHTVTFLATEQGQAEAIQDNTWMQSLRSVQTNDARKLTYCSDECEIKAAGIGTHNKKQIIADANPQQVNLAAKAAEQARKATQAMKQGSAVTLS